MRVEEMTKMRVERTCAERWMDYRKLPDSFRVRVRRYQQYKWKLTRGVEEENILDNLPKDLRRDIKRHICFHLLKRVPVLEKIDEQLLDTICDLLKPVQYTAKSNIVREGDPVDEMLFIWTGTLASTTTNGGKVSFLRDFCGEELLTWILVPQPSTNLPISTRTVVAIIEVEAFALKANDLKFLASRFVASRVVAYRNTSRFYSLQWRTWGARFIQAAWRRYCKRKLDKSLREAEDRLQDALANETVTSPNLGATRVP